MHHVDRATPWDEIWQAMEQLVREGKISYVGSSNFAAWDVALAQCAASARHFMGLTSEPSLYNLAVRTVELELIPALRSLGIGLIPYSPLHAACSPACSKPPPREASRTTGRITASGRTGTSSKRVKGCAGSWARSRRTWRWPGYCGTLSSPPRSSVRRRLRADLGALSVQF
jgi:aryl-alcohol dehydrogenase-like predicted oxidoreductase